MQSVYDFLNETMFKIKLLEQRLLTMPSGIMQELKWLEYIIY